MHHRSTKTRPTKPCLRRMVDPHLLASGVCEKERKSELNSRAAGKGVWHPSEGASRGAAAAPKRARAARRRACGVGEVKLGLLTRASRTTPTPARTMPPSHLTAKRDRRRTRRRRAVASQTTSAMRPPRRRGGRRVPAAGPSSVAGPARPSWPARLPTREDRARGQNVAKMTKQPYSPKYSLSFMSHHAERISLSVVRGVNRAIRSHLATLSARLARA